MKQGANSAVRFTTYSSLKQLVQGSAPAGQPLPGGVTFGLGALAGIVTVCQSLLSSVSLLVVFEMLTTSGLGLGTDSTMPLDVIKTRMQSIHAKQEYRNLVHCGWRIFKEEGALTLWKGAVPRLARLSVSPSPPSLPPPPPSSCPSLSDSNPLGRAV